jgi:hypothetical protein
MGDHDFVRQDIQRVGGNRAICRHAINLACLNLRLARLPVDVLGGRRYQPGNQRVVRRAVYPQIQFYFVERHGVTSYTM